MQAGSLKLLASFLGNVAASATANFIDTSPLTAMSLALGYVVTGGFSEKLRGRSTKQLEQIGRWSRRSWKDIQEFKREVAQGLELDYEGRRRLDELLGLLRALANAQAQSAAIHQASTKQLSALSRIVHENTVLERRWERYVLDRLDDILEQASLTAEERGALVEARRRRPPIELFTDEPADPLRNVYFYRERRVELLGRSRELAALEGSLAAQGTFLWWFITGPGGAGKSRLAWELCLRHQVEWCTGFLPEDVKFNGWDDWLPAEPTLIVVDYVYRRPEIGKVLRRLRRRCNGFEHPVRFLLLERAVGPEEPWHHEFAGAGEVAKRSLESGRYSGADGTAGQCALGPLDDDAVWEIAVQVSDAVGSEPCMERSRTTAALTAVEPKRRPLYLAYAADALASGEDTTRWDAQRLSSFVLRRERDRWHEYNVKEQWETLLAIATLLGGLDLSDGERPRALLDDPSLSRALPSEETLMTGWPFGVEGKEKWRREIRPVEPDPLGELFVLTRLGEICPSWRDRVLDVCWDTDPRATAFFCDRAALDFPQHPDLDPFLARRGPPELWAGLAVNFVLRVETNRRARVINDVRVLLERHDTPEITLPAAMAFLNATVENEDPKVCVALADQIESLLARQDTAEIALVAAKALVNATSAAAGKENYEACVALGGRIEDLLARYKSAEFGLQAAKALVNATAAAAAKKDCEACIALAGQIQVLLARYKTDEIAFEAAKALYNATVVEENSQACAALAGRIEGLLTRYKTADIALAAAQALVNGTALEKNPQACAALAGRIAGLLTRYKTAEIAFEAAKALVNVTAVEGNPKTCAALAGRIEGLLTRYKTADIALAAAKAIVNVTAVEEDPKACVALADRIEDLFAHHDNAEIALAAAHALHNATVKDPKARAALSGRIEGLLERSRARSRLRTPAASPARSTPP
jgi:hypothetical protein